MCVFVSISKEIAELEKRFKAEANKNVNYKPVYYASAFSNPELPVICQENPGRISFYEWGLIPFWVKNAEAALKLRTSTVNAKAETLAEKPSFRHAFGKKRCLVPADGFYEFQELNGKKYPWYIRLKDQDMFAFAGLTDSWTNPSTGLTQHTFTVITVEANPLMATIHNRKKRMPAILTPANEEKWLGKDTSPHQIMDLLKPYDENLMEAWTVRNFLKNKSTGTTGKEVMNRYDYPELAVKPSSLF